MVPLYNGIQQHLKPDERLVLLAWLDDLFGWESNRALLTDIKETTAGEERFQQAEVHRMLATDAAGEGINLQFCQLMINYELPWNPNRIEQRIGRLHRYGQDRTLRRCP